MCKLGQSGIRRQGKTVAPINDKDDQCHSVQIRCLKHRKAGLNRGLAPIIDMNTVMNHLVNECKELLKIQYSYK